MNDDGARLIAEVIVVTFAFAAIIGASFYVVILERRRFFGPNAYLKELSDRVGYLERQRERDHETIMRMALEMEKWKAYARLVAARLQAFTDDVPPPPEESARAAVVPEKRALTQVVAALFSRDEIDDLAFQLGINSEEIGGETRGKRARSLVDYAERHGMLDELVALAKRLRPEGEF